MTETQVKTCAYHRLFVVILLFLLENTIYNHGESTPLAIKIKNRDISESYFTGKAEHNGTEYTINIRVIGKRDKIIFQKTRKRKTSCKINGTDTIIENYRGKSKWIEIDSDDILHYVADHQDEFDTLEIIL